MIVWFWFALVVTFIVGALTTIEAALVADQYKDYDRHSYNREGYRQRYLSARTRLRIGMMLIPFCWLGCIIIPVAACYGTGWLLTALVRMAWGKLPEDEE